MAYAKTKSFTVKFTRVVDYRGAQLLPRFEHEVVGETLNEIIASEGEDIVEYARPV